MKLAGKRVLLIISGGIAAYKSLELIRLLRRAGAGVTCVLTRNGAQFVTALTVQALSETKVYTDLFSLTDDNEMGHIELSRAADLLVVAPASADILAKMATGITDDLATTVLLATDKPVLAVPAMNVRMWNHAATTANIATLRARGVTVMEPAEGTMACGEYGVGRLPEPPLIFAAVAAMLGASGALAGKHAIVTSGPTHEPIDPVRYLANRSSGRQGHAIATALAEAGARVTLISGPVALPDPLGLITIHVETAAEMQAAVTAALPADIAVCAAAVGDWRTYPAPHKLKKTGTAPSLALAENPDILASLAAPGPTRPCLVIGFAAETENLAVYAIAKRRKKSCDWLLANNVGGTSIMGGAENEVLFVTATGTEQWPRMSKEELGRQLVSRIASTFA